MTKAIENFLAREAGQEIDKIVNVRWNWISEENRFIWIQSALINLSQYNKKVDDTGEIQTEGLELGRGLGLDWDTNGLEVGTRYGAHHLHSKQP